MGIQVAATAAPISDTWTPSVSAGSGTFTSVSASGRYTDMSGWVFFDLDVTITTNGTAATSVIATMPFTADASGTYVVAGREDAATGNMLQGKIAAGGSSMSIFTTTNTYPGASGRVMRLSGCYKKA